MKKIICLILSIIMTATLFASCSSGEGGKTEKTDVSTPLALAVIIGAHKNFPAFSIVSDKLDNAIYIACRSYGEINVIVSEGIPEIKSNIKLEKPAANVNNAKHEQIAKSNSSAIKSLLPTLKATTDEVDLLRSLDLAADALAASSTSRRQLFIYDSGLCTTGVLSQLTEDYISADPEEIAGKLDLMGALPALEGVTVIWQGIGCVSGEQEAIPASVKSKLENMWKTILEKAGAKVEFDTMPVSGAEASELPAVTAIDFEEDKIVITKNGFVKFDDKTLKFKPDTADFVDEAAAREVLKPIAEQLIATPSLTVYIAGTTATVGVTEDTPVTGIELSAQRADACKNILVSMGVPASQLICKGLGCADNVLKTEDVDADGNLIEEKAALNRAIYIFSSDSDTAASLGL